MQILIIVINATGLKNARFRSVKKYTSTGYDLKFCKTI